MTRVEIRVDPCGSVEVVVAMGSPEGVSVEQIAATIAQHPVIALAAARQVLGERVEVERARTRGERPCD
jgi:hypothetical protein